jgi:hypothetical protein
MMNTTQEYLTYSLFLLLLPFCTLHIDSSELMLYCILMCLICPSTSSHVTFETYWFSVVRSSSQLQSCRAAPYQFSWTAYSVYVNLQSVQSVGWLDVQGASENILSADTVGSPSKLKIIHLVLTWSSESVLHHRLLQKRHSVVLCSVSLWIMWDNI